MEVLRVLVVEQQRDVKVKSESDARWGLMGHES